MDILHLAAPCRNVPVIFTLELMVFDLWRLRRKADHLSIYNDKGSTWAKHTEERASAERAKRLSEIRTLVARIGRENLPVQFVDALDSGALARDGSGVYAETLNPRAP